MAAVTQSPHAPQQLLLAWDTEVRNNADGSVTLVPGRPLSDMSAKRAAKILGVSVWTIGDLFRLGLLKGSKPGARVKRKDGRGSNAALRLDSGSVLTYKQDQERAAREWVAARD